MEHLSHLTKLTERRHVKEELLEGMAAALGLSLPPLVVGSVPTITIAEEPALHEILQYEDFIASATSIHEIDSQVFHVFTEQERQQHSK